MRSFGSWSACLRDHERHGGKRFTVTDTLGLLIVAVVLAASVRDRDGAKTTLLSAYLISPIRFVFADGQSRQGH